MKISIFALLALTFQSIAASSPDCSFEDEYRNYLPESAASDAKALFIETRKVSFVGVANSFGPSRPGFEEVKSGGACFIFGTEWRLFWVGADSAVCVDHEALNKRAMKYAENFNRKMLELASKSDSYKCSRYLKTAN